MNKTIKFLSLIAGSAMFVGCQDYDLGVTPSTFAKKEFTENFEKAFGKVDPTQDWNVASRYSVTVENPSGSNVKIYANDGGKYKIVGNFANVEGTKQLFFDAPKGIETVLVTNGMSAEEVLIGSTVSLSNQTRAIATGSGDSKVSFTANDDASSYLYFNRAQMAAYTDVVPESNDNGAHLNWGKVTSDFTMIGTGETYILYPMFWDSSHKHILGIYYFDNNDRVEVDLYTDKSGDEVQHTLNGIDWVDETDARMYTHYFDTKKNGDQYDAVLQPIEWKLKGIKVTVKKGLSYGFYVKRKANGGETIDKTFYSTQSINPDVAGLPLMCDHGNGHRDLTAIPHAATFEYEGRSYYCFEDWEGFSTDGDLNDFNFIISGNTITVDEEAYEWTVACEDLGNTFDIDFNDVVFNVKYTSGETTATVTPLAAGGTLATHVFFNGTDLGEIHHLLDPSLGYATSGSYPVIESGNASSFTIDVTSGFSMAAYTSEQSGVSTQEALNNMGGFSLMVLPAGTQDAATVTGSTSSQYIDATIINAPSTGEVPQMLCLASPFKFTRNDGVTVNRHWGWSEEMISIKTTYPEFATWAQDKTQATDWYKHPAAAVVGQKDVATVGGGDAGAGTHELKENNISLFNMTSDSQKDGHDNYAKTIDATSSAAVWMLPILSRSNGDFTFESSDETVATVDATGLVAILGNGTTAIKISQAASEYYQAGVISVDLTVTGFCSPNLTVTSATTPVLAPEGTYTLTWTSDNSSNVTATYEIISQTPTVEGQTVVTLDGDVVTGVNSGTAVVRVSIPAQGTYIAAHADVTIIVDSRVPSDLAVTSPSMNITVNDSYQLAKGVDFTTSSTGSISYSSSDPAIASVDADGTIHAIAVGGPVDITITVDGDDDYTMGMQPIKVTVKPTANTTEYDLTSLITGDDIQINAADYFNGKDEVTVTLIVKAKTNSWEGNTFNFYSYVGNYDGAPGNIEVTKGQTNEFTLNEASVSKIKNDGTWKISFNGNSLLIESFKIK